MVWKDSFVNCMQIGHSFHLYFSNESIWTKAHIFWQHSMTVTWPFSQSDMDLSYYILHEIWPDKLSTSISYAYFNLMQITLTFLCLRTWSFSRLFKNWSKSSLLYLCILDYKLCVNVFRIRLSLQIDFWSLWNFVYDANTILPPPKKIS